MRPKATAVMAVMASSLIVFFSPAGAAAEGTKKLASFKTGYFYASVTKEDGVIQLSDCAELKGVGKFAGNKSFLCVHEGKGFRCTANESLDVIFVFSDKQTCEADQKQTLNSEED